MAVLEGGTSASLAEVGAAAAIPLHVTAKPLPVGTLGHYAVAAETGAIAAGMAANGQLFSCRWTDATRFAAISSIIVTGMRATTAFAVGTITIKATVARSFTASASGGTPITLTGDNQQLRTSFGASLFGDMRIASTAALTAGTQTLDTQDIGQITTHSSAGWNAATPIIGSTYLPTVNLFVPRIADGEHPLILAQNEGVVVRSSAGLTIATL